MKKTWRFSTFRLISLYFAGVMLGYSITMLGVAVEDPAIPTKFYGIFVFMWICLSVCVLLRAKEEAKTEDTGPS